MRCRQQGAACIHSTLPFFLETPHEVHQLPIHRRSSGKFLRLCTRGLRGGGGGSAGDTAAPTVEKPAITTPPANQSVEAGKTATFTVTATGGETLAYQWKKNGTDVSGATTSTYTTPVTAIADNGTKYSVAVTNSAGTTTSSEATLAVTAAAVVVATKPAITTHPAAQTVVTGTTASFSVSASGTAPLSYQWKKDGKDIAGATSNPYTIAAATMADGGAYSVVITNSAGSVTSNEAKLGLSATAVKAAIESQPANLSVVVGETAKFSVTATGTSLSYQWKKNGTDISGATSNPYTIAAATMADGGAYSVVVTNSLGTVTSNDATLTVTATAVAPAITTQPAAQTVTEGQSATFSVTASGTAPFTYQWKKNGTDIEGVTTSSHTTDATAIGDSGAVFTVVVTNSVGSVTSSGAALTVNAAPPAISAQPTAQTITAGQTATFSVTATGTGTLSYQWKKNGRDITGGSGATTNTYTTPAMGYAGNGAVYSVVVSDSVGTTTSNNATLTVSKSTTAQSYGYVANASDDLYDKTECVQDNSTGLIWEGKTASPATSRLGTSTYTNYDSTTSLQKWNGVWSIPNQTEIDASTNSIGYKNSVNASALCGFTDWRLPNIDELKGVAISGPSNWFPNTLNQSYWSSTPNGGGSQGDRGSAVYGSVGFPYDRVTPAPLRLVRASN